MYGENDTPPKSTEKPSWADTVEGSESTDLRKMIRSMQDDFNRKIESLTDSLGFAEKRAERAESRLETLQNPKGLVGGAFAGARPKTSYHGLGPTRSESELERDNALSNVGQLTGGKTPPTSSDTPWTPSGGISGPSSGPDTPTIGVSGSRASPVPKRGRRSAAAAYLGRFSEEDAQLFDAPEIAEMGLDYVCENNNLVSEVRKQEHVAAMHLMTTASISVKRKAIDTPEFTGDSDFTRWFSMFAQDCAANGWNEEECYTTLRVKIRNGPARVALALGKFDSTGDGDYRSLIRALTVACGAEDIDLRWRRAEGVRQTKGETSHNFGLRALRDKQ